MPATFDARNGVADSGKLAAGIVALGVVLLGGGGWLLLRPDAPAPATDAAPAREEAPASSAPQALAPRAGATPVSAAVVDPDSTAGRIADLQARIRDEQTAHLAASTDLGERIRILREEQTQLEASIEALEQGRMARIGSRGDKQGERCDPAQPDSRACKRQAALEGKLDEAEAEREALVGRLSQAREQEQALLTERAEHLRAVDTCEERLRSDPELVELIRRLAEQPG